jgi:hypothetical protein
MLMASLTGAAAMAAPPTPSQVTSTPADVPVIDAAEQAAGYGVLARAVEAFGSAPVVRCDTQVRMQSPNGTERAVEVQSVFGPDGFAWIKAPESMVYVKDGVMRIVLQSVYDRYLEVPVGDSMVDGVGAVMGDEALAGFEAMMREGRPPEAWLETALMRTIGKPTVTGVEVVPGGDGTDVTRVTLVGAYGTGWVDLDPDTHRLVGSHAHLIVVPDENLEPFEMVMDLTTEVEFLETLPEGLDFDPGIRTPVGTRQDLDPVLRNRLKIGQPAPELVAVTPEGAPWQLKDHAGTPVVLCFWTSWANASRPGVEQLERLYTSLTADGQTPDAICMAVNVLEHEPELDVRREAAGGMWRQAGLTVPLLVAPDEVIQTKWAVTSVPYLILVGPDGTILDAEVGVSESWVKRVLGMLKDLPAASGD